MNFKDSINWILHSCLEAINSPIALSLAIQHQGASLEVLPEIKIANYDNWLSYYKDSQAVALFSKNEDFKTTSNLKKKAIDDFYAIEERNLRSNLMFESITRNESHSLLMKVRENVYKIVRAQPSNAFYGGGYPIFGPGATSSCRGSDTTYLDKLQAKPECTLGAVDILDHLSRGDFSRFDDYDIVRGNEFFTVPKNYKTLRSCCVEPHLNTWAQRALGLDLKRRLKESNYNLEMIPDTNKVLLRDRFTEISTLDLKQASDTIYYKIVKDVFPPVWFDLMNRARSHYTKIENSWVKLEKFSSMGNGFTFEMETILFLAICRSIVPQSKWPLVTVFGDDIIVPIEYGNQVAQALELLHFTINTEKSFIDGVFKESCGTDVWHQSMPINVRPIFLRGFPRENRPIELVALANYIRRLSIRIYGVVPLGSPFKHAYKACLKMLPKQYHFYGPDPYWHSDLKMTIDLVTRDEVSVLYGNRAVFTSTVSSYLKSKAYDSDGWLHDSNRNDKRRLVEIPKFAKKYSNYTTKAQMVYALSGGDSEGCFSRNTPTKLQTLKLN